MTTDSPTPGPTTSAPAPAPSAAGPAPAPSASTPALAGRKPAPAVIPPVRFERVPWRRVLLFAAIAYALFALFAAPFWFLDGGIANPWFTPVIAIGMWSPAIASVIMAKGVEKTSWRTRVGLRWRGRWRAIILWSLVAPLLILAVGAVSVLIMAARGVPADLTAGYFVEQMSGQLAEQTGTAAGPGLVVAILLIQLAIGLPITLLATLGEEIGWRGWLWPALRPLGKIPAALVGGVIWALWHLPILLIGYNYPGVSRLIAIPMFTLLCCALFLLLAALTERAGGNPLPAAFAHAAWNSWASTFLLLVSVPATATALNQLLDTHAGLTGAVLVALLGAAIMPWRAREWTDGDGRGPAAGRGDVHGGAVRGEPDPAAR